MKQCIEFYRTMAQSLAYCVPTPMLYFQVTAEYPLFLPFAFDEVPKGENNKGCFYRSWDLVEYWNMCRNWSKENEWFQDGARRKDSQEEVSWIWWLRARVGGEPGWHEVLGVGTREVGPLQRWMKEGITSWAEELTLNTDNDQEPVCVPA